MGGRPPTAQDTSTAGLLRDLGPIAGGGERARFYAVCTALEDLAFGLETGSDGYRTNALAALDELT